MILAFGSSGQLSQSFQKIYTKNDILFSSTNDLDLIKSEDIIPYIDTIKPSCIINFSAFNKVDDAEKNDSDALKINYEAVSKMASYSYANSIPIIHFSSDYVFDGNQDFPYHEDDECGPINKYGISKFLGERAIIDSNAQFLIIRTSFLYSRTSVSFPQIIKKMIENNSEKLYGATDIITSPTYSGNLAEALLQVLPTFIESNDRGIYHFSDAGEVSRFDYMNELINILRQANPSIKPIQLIPVKDAFFNLPAKRPLYSALSCQKIFNDFNVPQKSWKSALRECFK
jgi:dTDP-4-dehydrorhamnose reductase